MDMECPARATGVGEAMAYAADFRHRFGWEPGDLFADLFLIALALFSFIYQFVQFNGLLLVAGIGFTGLVLWDIYDHVTGRIHVHN